MNKNKTAIVVGATGATGKYIVSKLLAHSSYTSVVVLVRRALDIDDPKLTTHVIDFDTPDKWKHLVKGDELFSALGTTAKIAGSKEAQYKVDYSYQMYVAEAAKANNVPLYMLVSSPGAKPKASSFYLRMKGELDAAVAKLDFDRWVLIKPAIIDGERPDNRIAEKIGAAITKGLGAVIPGMGRYRPITGEQLAQAIVNIAQKELPEGKSEFQMGALFRELSE